MNYFAVCSGVGQGKKWLDHGGRWVRDRSYAKYFSGLEPALDASKHLTYSPGRVRILSFSHYNELDIRRLRIVARNCANNNYDNYAKDLTFGSGDESSDVKHWRAG